MSSYLWRSRKDSRLSKAFFFRFFVFYFQDSPFYSALFYPGQKVAGSARAFKEAKWLSGMKPIMNNQAQVKGIVEEVRLNRVSSGKEDCEILFALTNPSRPYDAKYC